MWVSTKQKVNALARLFQAVPPTAVVESHHLSLPVLVELDDGRRLWVVFVALHRLSMEVYLQGYEDVQGYMRNTAEGFRSVRVDPDGFRIITVKESRW